MVATTSKNRCIQNSITQSTPCVESLTDPTGVRLLAVDPNQAATLLNSTYSSLEKDRAIGHMGVPYIRAGRRIVYRLSDLDAWLTANRVVPSSRGVDHV